MHVCHLRYNSKLYKQNLEFVVCRECSNGSDVTDMTDVMFEGTVRVFSLQVGLVNGNPTNELLDMEQHLKRVNVGFFPPQLST
jgi:hypothetical protein